MQPAATSLRGYRPTPVKLLASWALSGTRCTPIRHTVLHASRPFPPGHCQPSSCATVGTHLNTQRLICKPYVKPIYLRVMKKKIKKTPYETETLQISKLLTISHIRYISREYASSSYMKVIGSRSRSREQQGWISLFPQCKTSIGNNSGSVKHTATKFACSMGFSAKADRMV